MGHRNPSLPTLPTKWGAGVSPPRPWEAAPAAAGSPCRSLRQLLLHRWPGRQARTGCFWAGAVTKVHRFRGSWCTPRLSHRLPPSTPAATAAVPTGYPSPEKPATAEAEPEQAKWLGDHQDLGQQETVGDAAVRCMTLPKAMQTSLLRQLQGRPIASSQQSQHPLAWRSGPFLAGPGPALQCSCLRTIAPGSERPCF